MQKIKVLFTFVNGTISRRQLVMPIPTPTWAVPSIKLEGDWGKVPTEPQVMQEITQIEKLLGQEPGEIDGEAMAQACKLARRAGIAEAFRDLESGNFADVPSLKKRFQARVDVGYFFAEMDRFRKANPTGDTAIVYQTHDSSRCLADPRLPHFIAGYEKAVMRRLRQLA